MDIRKEFSRIMQDEFYLRTGKYPLSRQIHEIIENPEMFQDLAWRLIETTRLSFVPRSYNSHYGLDDSAQVFESVGAHTNLVVTLVDYAIHYYYSPDFGEPGSEYIRTIDDYSYREIMEAARLHDLPENITGDIPDNSSRDESQKDLFEQTYYAKFLDKYPKSDRQFTAQVAELLGNMHNPRSPTGRILYLADKTAALIVTLCLDASGFSPMMKEDDKQASARDQTEMKIADFNQDGWHRASEMWAIDFFQIRKAVDLDKTYFFTAVIVMITLIQHHQWYSWRERAYHH